MIIKAVLLDLDDTLITSHTDEFFPRYLQLLSKYASHLTPDRNFTDILLSAFNKALNEYEPTETLFNRILRHLANVTSHNPETLKSQFKKFYEDEYPVLKNTGLVQPREQTPSLLTWLHENEYITVVATNPGLPRRAIEHRLEWGNVDVTHFKLITVAEEMHFGKPHPEYYAEVLLRLGIKPCEAIMVGDDWESDIIGAAAVGLHVFWVTEECLEPPDPDLNLAGYGTYAQFVERVRAGWLETIEWPGIDCGALIHRLAAYPGAVHALLRKHDAATLEHVPAEHEWSARDIVCHLRDHESEDRDRLERILSNTSPFLSANLDPWAHYKEYASVSARQALDQFANERDRTVKWLSDLPDDVWDRPARDAIFGPTSFQEVVRFMTEHDRTHLAQMQAAVASAADSEWLLAE